MKSAQFFRENMAKWIIMKVKKLGGPPDLWTPIQIGLTLVRSIRCPSALGSICFVTSPFSLSFQWLNMASFVPMQGRGRGLGRGRGGPSNSPWSNPSPWSKPQQPKPPGPPKQQQQQQSPQHGRGTSNIEVCMDLLSQCVKYTDNLQLKRTEVELIELILPWYTKWMLSENNWLQNNRTVQNSISHFILRDVLLKQPKYKRRELVHHPAAGWFAFFKKKNVAKMF